MLYQIAAAFVVLLAACGCVFLLMLFLQRLSRPDGEQVYELRIRLSSADAQNAAKISYIAERLRFFGEDRCTTVTVLCESLQAEETLALKNMFQDYSFVRFLVLDAEKMQN